MPQPALILCLAALSAAFAVGFGAFGAHALKAVLSDAKLATYQTAVAYHFYHSLALLGLGVARLALGPNPWLSASALCFVLGLLCFCGSLYALALGGPRWLGPITPLGGLLFILGWLALAVAATKYS